jgi:hypothetical protein
MDFIERLFGIAPDGGSGSLEFVLFAIPLAAIIYLIARRWLRWTTWLTQSVASSGRGVDPYKGAAP